MNDKLAIPGTADHERQKILTEIEHSRANLLSATEGLQAQLKWMEMPQKLRASVQRHPLLWLGTACALGALLGIWTERKNERNFSDD